MGQIEWAMWANEQALAAGLSECGVKGLGDEGEGGRKAEYGMGMQGWGEDMGRGFRGREAGLRMQGCGDGIWRGVRALAPRSDPWLRPPRAAPLAPPSSPFWPNPPPPGDGGSERQRGRGRADESIVPIVSPWVSHAVPPPCHYRELNPPPRSLLGLLRVPPPSVPRCPHSLEMPGVAAVSPLSRSHADRRSRGGGWAVQGLVLRCVRHVSLWDSGWEGAPDPVQAGRGGEGGPTSPSHCLAPHRSIPAPFPTEFTPTLDHISAPLPMDLTPYPWLPTPFSLTSPPPQLSAAGAFVCLLEYPRSNRQKGSTMERW